MRESTGGGRAAERTEATTSTCTTPFSSAGVTPSSVLPSWFQLSQLGRPPGGLEKVTSMLAEGV